MVAQATRLQVLKRALTGLFLRPIWTPLHQLPMYKACPAGSLTVAENQAPRLLNLPSSLSYYRIILHESNSLNPLFMEMFVTSYLAMQDTYVRIVEWISEAKLFAGGRFS